MARRRRYDDEDDDVDDLDAYDLRSARHRDRGVRPRRRFALVAGVAVLAATAWFAPAVIVSTGLRDLPLQGVFAGIDGAVESGGARWEWFGPLAWHDVVLRDRSGRAAAVVPHVAIDRGLLSLLLDRRDLGTVRLTAPEVFVEVRPGGSSLEDVLAPWLAGFAAGDGGASPSFALEVVDGRVTLVDLEHADGWRLDDLVAAAMVAATGELSDWTLAGHVRRTGVPSPTETPRRSPGAAARTIDEEVVTGEAVSLVDEEALHELLEAEDLCEDGRVEATPLPTRERLACGSRAGFHHTVELQARHAHEVVEVGASEGVRHAREHTR